MGLARGLERIDWGNDEIGLFVILKRREGRREERKYEEKKPKKHFYIQCPAIERTAWYFQIASYTQTDHKVFQNSTWLRHKNKKRLNIVPRRFQHFFNLTAIKANSQRNAAYTDHKTYTK